MRKCGLNTWCCHSKHSDTSCCDGGQLFDLESPIETVKSEVTQKTTQVPPQLILSTIDVVSFLTIEHTLTRSTLQRPPSKVPSVVESSASSGQQSTRTSFTAWISSTQGLQGYFTQPTALESSPSHSSSSSSPRSSPVTIAPSTPQATSAPKPEKQIETRAALGLGVVLCAVVVLATVGLSIWFIRMHRRRCTREKKLVISSPIPLELIPMFEVANTDWEMPADRDMPTELSANGRTPQTWL